MPRHPWSSAASVVLAMLERLFDYQLAGLHRPETVSILWFLSSHSSDTSGSPCLACSSEDSASRSGWRAYPTEAALPLNQALILEVCLRRRTSLLRPHTMPPSRTHQRSLNRMLVCRGRSSSFAASAGVFCGAATEVRDHVEVALEEEKAIFR